MELTKGNLELIIDGQLEEIAQFIFTRSQENILKYKAFNTGFMMRSCHAVEVMPSGERRIHYDAPYAGYVEFGTDPHRMPLEPLVNWARKKLGITNETEARKVAWAIWQKIATKGIDPKPFLRDAINEAVSVYQNKKIG